VTEGGSDETSDKGVQGKRDGLIDSVDTMILGAHTV